MKNDKNIFKGKTILVTGGTGSIGSEIVRQLIPFNPKAIRVFARSEYGHHRLSQELGLDKKMVRFLVGDIRDKERLRLAMEGVDIVFHAAAQKHVDICEDNPFEAVKTNILGTQNLIDLVLEFEIGKFIGISTDKAVEPENVMGVSKLMAEKLILSSFYYQGDKKTKFSCVRFGNVLGSRGSILPLLKRQIVENGYVTLTDPEMTRFVMSISDAVNLVLKAAELTQRQEIFVLKMPSVKIGDLIECAIKCYSPLAGKGPSDIKIKIIGNRGGEKRHEKLLADYEISQALETKDMYILTPRMGIWGYEVPKRIYPGAVKIKNRQLSSENAPKLGKKEIMDLIKEADGGYL